MTTITIARPATVREPRGAAWAAQAVWSVWQFLSRLSASRSELRETAGRVAEAAAVRRLADSWRDQDPRFAADLYAAADRHENG